MEVKCDLLGLREAAENPKDDAVETFLNQVTAHLPKEEGTPISKTPVNVTLQGKIYSDFTYRNHLKVLFSLPVLQILH